MKRGRLLRRAFIGGLMLACGTACAATPTRAADASNRSRAPAPVASVEVMPAVERDPEPDLAESDGPLRAERFEEFLPGFVEHMTLAERPHVDGELGVMVATNVGGFPNLDRYQSYGALLSGTRLELKDAQRSCVAAGWTKHDDVPRFSCDTNAYEVSDKCVWGTARGGKFESMAEAMTGRVLSEEYGAELQRVSRATERSISHYALIAPQHLVLYFGNVDGWWRLLGVDAETPCSA